MKYDTPEEGEWVQPIRKGYKMMCCDCGLVHTLDFRIVGDKRKFIHFRAFRDEEATDKKRIQMLGDDIEMVLKLTEEK